MTQKTFLKLFLMILVLVLGLTSAFGQKTRPKAKPTAALKAKSVIFAVFGDGASIEPIAYLENGKLAEAATGMSDQKVIDAFTKTYYPLNATYSLIFGGKVDGSVTVKKFNSGSDCAKNMADVSIKAGKANLKGFVMALATNGVMKKRGSGTRRKPTFAERGEIDKLVNAEFSKKKAPLTGLNYHNLTAIDVDGDGKIELVGSYWVEPNAKERGLLFFIAEKNSGGKYAFTYSEYGLTKEADVMNSEIKALDEGIYHELLLESFDVDGDGVGEIFTIQKGFEANSFYVYRREEGTWKRIFEGSNYHCGY